MKACSFPFLLLLTLTLTPALPAEDWNQWRGPLRSGELQDSSFLWPETVAEERLVKRWEIALDESYASPVVAEGKIFSVATRNKELEVVRAFDLASGKPSWEASWQGSMKVPFFAAKNGSWTRGTPVVAGGAIYVGGMRDVLVKLDAATGKELWRVDFTQREGTEVPAFGHVTSPLCDEGALYVQAGCAVAKLDAGTGKTIWRALEDRRAMFGSAFSSPVMATLCGKRQVVAQTRSTLGGLDPVTGDVLWSIPVEAFRGMNILTPIILSQNRIFTATYGGGSFLFEITAKSDGTFSVQEKWRLKDLEGYMASPVVLDDHIYLLSRDQHLQCIAADTGKIAWTSKEKFGHYWSMVRQGDKILALDQTGELILFKASPQSFQLLGRRLISPQEATWAHLGVQGDLLLVRSLKSLTVYQWKPEPL